MPIIINKSKKQLSPQKQRDIGPLKKTIPPLHCNEPHTTSSKGALSHMHFKYQSEIHRKASTMDSSASNAISRLISPRAYNSNVKNSFADHIKTPLSIADNIMPSSQMGKHCKDIISFHRKTGSEMNLVKRQKIVLNCNLLTQCRVARSIWTLLTERIGKI